MQLYLMFLFSKREFCILEIDKEVGSACKFCQVTFGRYLHRLAGKCFLN